MTALLRDRPKDAFGRHRYDPADFGWTYAEISEEFSDYVTRYDVRPEKDHIRDSGRRELAGSHSALAGQLLLHAAQLTVDYGPGRSLPRVT